MKKGTYILGINSAYHETSACLIKDGRLLSAVEEERFTRVRHGKVADLCNPHQLPFQSIRYCLEQAGIEAKNIDFISYSFNPEKRREHNACIPDETTPNGAGTEEGEKLFYDLLMTIPEELSKFLGVDIHEKFHWIDHHLCHASSAYFTSPYKESAVLSVDGIGEATCNWFGHGKENKIETVHEVSYPNSLGLLWTKASRYLGFGEYGQWKVMALAAYGDPERYYQSFRKFVDFNEEGHLGVEAKVLQYRVDNFSAFTELFGEERKEGEDPKERHKDFAAALQKMTGEIILSFAHFLHRKTGSRNLCYAGGVALNCVANNLLLEEGPFENVFIQPAANDAGTAIGAGFYLWNNILENPRNFEMTHAYWGPSYSNEVIAGTLDEYRLDSREENKAEELGATLIASGKIVAWFQDRMEFGPRALGNRSILADPRRSDMALILNEKIKHREFFRPFAASILKEDVDEWFEVEKGSPSDSFMLFAHKIRKDKLGLIPAVTHYDGTTRIQSVDRQTNPRFYALIAEFKKITGIPLILNTSFNDREPIIASPTDAISTCLKAGITDLVLGTHVVDLSNIKRENQEAIESKQGASSLSSFVQKLYTDTELRETLTRNPEEVLARIRSVSPESESLVRLLLNSLKGETEGDPNPFDEELATTGKSVKLVFRSR